MPWVNKPFAGNDLFHTIRSALDGSSSPIPVWITNRGMFAGRDGIIRYVIMDASFYRLEIFIRPLDETFTASAQAAQIVQSDIRVIANGQYFGNNQIDYCYNAPCAVQWQGEIINAHVVLPGTPPSFPGFRYIGQFDGRTEAAFDVATGNPSAVQAYGGFNHAMGRLSPIITDGVPATQAQIGSFWHEPPWRGKTILGIHRGSNTVFVYAHANIQNAAGTVTVPHLINTLIDMGVNDAVQTDSGTSTALIVDQMVAVAPAGSFDRKNKSIPVGPMFRLKTLGILNTSSLRLNADETTRADFLSNDPVENPIFFNREHVHTGITGEMRLANAGIEITLTSMGRFTPANGSGLSEAAVKFDIILPLVLHSASDDITGSSVFSTADGSVSAILSLSIGDPRDDGTMTGTMRISTAQGFIGLHANWQLLG